ncbi:hypothetical protein [Isobaculum melis]|uniref:Uncharacterized protein n=1 Tax=Isobaculum melis TaxID=142588 RepID=A0A1H9RVI1_9LACT|nr:hypothetical protein [Isobaculum melis]SER76881.1 hypothetical protein SAMN04488559_105125 [Isobaculum melis]
MKTFAQYKGLFYPRKIGNRLLYVSYNQPPLQYKGAKTSLPHEQINLENNLEVEALILDYDEGNIDNFFPMYLPDLLNLKFLQIPIHYLSKLTIIPENLERLVLINKKGYLSEENKKTILWPKELILSDLKYLHIANSHSQIDIDCLFGMAQKHFPNLAFLNLTLDKKGILMEEISNFSSLKALELGMVKKKQIFDAIDDQIHYLSLSNIQNIEGISNLSKLKKVVLNSVNGELDCRLFKKLLFLEELTIYNSFKIKNVEALLDMDSLKMLTAVNCKKAFGGMKHMFESKAFDLLSIEHS